MRNRVRRNLFFLSILVLLILLGSVVSGKKDENFSGNVQAEGTPEFENNVIESNAGYNRLLQHYQKADTGSKEGYLVSGISAEGFPEYYCGAYMNTSGGLVVLLNRKWDDEALEEARKEIYEKTFCRNIAFRMADNSYSRLINVMESILLFTQSDEYQSCGFNIVGFGIDDEKNTVILYSDITDEKDKLFVVSLTEGFSDLQFEYQTEGDRDTASSSYGSGI
ncbi:MAG: hypothetical protein IJL98_04140 [Lachnospiraceae bacterium]|nr:hypothetical protein [Lachnospiraceae bacterium]